AEHELELLLLLLCARLVGADGEAHVAGTNDRPRITPLLLAPVVQRGVAHDVELGRQERHVPAVGVARDHAEQSPLALPADPQPEARLHGPGLAGRVVEVHFLAMNRDALAAEQASENRDGLLEKTETVLDPLERHAEGAKLVLVPARPAPQLAPPATQMVD